MCVLPVRIHAKRRVNVPVNPGGAIAVTSRPCLNIIPAGALTAFAARPPAGMMLNLQAI